MRLILLGAPGVGKGTQAIRLSKELRISHICSGDLLRQAVSQGSELGIIAKGYMNKGELVPDSLVTQLTLDRITRQDVNSGFILDGFPRNLKQANELKKALDDKNQDIDAVIYLDANEDIIIQRLTGRRLCEICKANFHLKNMPPKNDGICDRCGGRLQRRSDDNEETIKNRLKVYNNETASLIDYYKNLNKLEHIIANEEADVVLKKLLKILNGKTKNERRS